MSCFAQIKFSNHFFSIPFIVKCSLTKNKIFHILILCIFSGGSPYCLDGNLVYTLMSMEFFLFVLI